MRAIVSVIGKDKKGIIAKVSNILFEQGANIIDISQTIMDEFFTMIMMAEIEDGSTPSITTALSNAAKELGVDIRVQHEDVFNSMHRV